VRIFNTVEPVAPLYRDLIPHWLALGWRVEVMMSRAEYRANSDKVWLTKGVKIRWIPGFGLKAHKKGAKFIIMLSYFVFTSLKSLFGQDVDRNLFLTQPPLFFLWGAILKKLRKQPYFVVLMDLYPDVAIQAKLLRAGSFFAKLLTRISRYGLSRADGVIAIGRCMKQRLLNYGVAEERIRLITNWTNPDAIRTISNEKNSFRQEKGWQKKFVVLYSGNIGVSHYFDDILKVSLQFRQHPDILFVFTGYGQRLSEIKSFKKKHNLENIKLLPFQDRDKLSLSLSAGDIHFVSLRAGFEGLVVPSKIYGILAVGRPVIYQGDARGEIAHLIKEEDVGLVVPIANPGELAEAILTYLNDPLLALNQGSKARRLAETQYNSRLACEKYSQALKIAVRDPN
jgi:glycosyltransferase involved in cell wall biosynthesis